MYIIYGKVIKSYKFKNEVIEPQPTFKALNERGKRVSRLGDAYVYETKQAAEDKLNIVRQRLERLNRADCIAFEIRKKK